MELINFTRETLLPIQQFNSIGSFSKRIAKGDGNIAIHCVYFEPGGQVGLHPTGLEQLFLIVQGQGWVVGEGNIRVDLETGQGVHLARKELHAKGTDTGMVAIMIQSSEFLTDQYAT